MSRKLRHIDDVGKIMEWTAAMTAINRLLKDINIKEYRDDWRPWRERNKMGKVRKMDIDEEVPTKGMKKIQEQVLPPLMSPTMRTKKIGIKDDGGMIAGENDRGKTKPKFDPKAAVLEMLSESKDQQEPNKFKGWLSLKEKRVVQKQQMWNQQAKATEVSGLPHEKRKRKREMKVREADWGDEEDEGETISADLRSFIEKEGITLLDP